MKKLFIKKAACILVVFFSLTLCTNTYCADDLLKYANPNDVAAFQEKYSSDANTTTDSKPTGTDKPAVPTQTNNTTYSTSSNSESPGADAFSIGNVYSPQNAQNPIDSIAGPKFNDYATQANNPTGTPPSEISLFGTNVEAGATANGSQVGPTIPNAQALPPEVKLNISKTDVKSGNTLSGKAVEYQNKLLAAGVPAKDVPPLYGKGGLIEMLATYNGISNPNMIGAGTNIELPDVLQTVGDKGEAQYAMNLNRTPYLPYNKNYNENSEITVEQISQMDEEMENANPKPLNVAQAELKDLQKDKAQLFQTMNDTNKTWTERAEAKKEYVATFGKIRTAEENLQLARSTDPLTNAQDNINTLQKDKAQLFQTMNDTSKTWTERAEAKKEYVATFGKIRTAEENLQLARSAAPSTSAQDNINNLQKEQKASFDTMNDTSKTWTERAEAKKEYVDSFDKIRNAKANLETAKTGNTSQVQTTKLTTIPVKPAPFFDSQAGYKNFQEKRDIWTAAKKTGNQNQIIAANKAMANARNEWAAVTNDPGYEEKKASHTLEMANYQVQVANITGNAKEIRNAKVDQDEAKRVLEKRQKGLTGPQYALQIRPSDQGKDASVMATKMFDGSLYQSRRKTLIATLKESELGSPHEKILRKDLANYDRTMLNFNKYLAKQGVPSDPEERAEFYRFMARANGQSYTI